MVLIPGLERSPGGEHGNLLQYSCLEYPHGQRSLAGYGPLDGKQSDTTERLSTAQPQRDGNEDSERSRNVSTDMELEKNGSNSVAELLSEPPEDQDAKK